MTMDLIVAVNSDWAIGKKDSLLYHIPEDMRFFRKKTLGQVIVVGRKTLESFPDKKPLPGRINVVLSHSAESFPGTVPCRDINDLPKIASMYPDKEMIVCGGGSVYRALYKKCRYLFVTKIEAHTSDADTFFPVLDGDPDFAVVQESETMQNDNGLRFRFVTYENKAVKSE